MYRLDISAIDRWENQGHGNQPATLDTVCPICGKQANFTVHGITYDRARATMSAFARCSSCRNNVSIWSINHGEELYMRPAPIARQPIEGADKVPPAIRRAYEDTIQVYNAGVWNPTATQARVTLEGIVQEILPEEDRKGSLANQIKKLADSDSVDLAAPLITLSDALRERREHRRALQPDEFYGPTDRRSDARPDRLPSRIPLHAAGDDTGAKP